jgi:hypothetical protein
LQKLFDAASFQLQDVYRYNDLFLDDNQICLLHGLVEIDEQEIEVRVDASRNAAEPANLNLRLIVFEPEEGVKTLEATIFWGSYRQSAEVSHFGLARFQPLKYIEIFDGAGRLIHDLECRLVVGMGKIA